MRMSLQRRFMRTFVKTTNQLPGDVVAGTGARSEFVAHFENAWADVYNAQGRHWSNERDYERAGYEG
jgi:hypothetical protein